MAKLNSSCYGIREMTLNDEKSRQIPEVIKFGEFTVRRKTRLAEEARVMRAAEEEAVNAGEERQKEARRLAEEEARQNADEKARRLAEEKTRLALEVAHRQRAEKLEQQPQSLGNKNSQARNKRGPSLLKIQAEQEREERRLENQKAQRQEPLLRASGKKKQKKQPRSNVSMSRLLSGPGSSVDPWGNSDDGDDFVNRMASVPRDAKLGRKRLDKLSKPWTCTTCCYRNVQGNKMCEMCPQVIILLLCFPVWIRVL